MYYGKVTDKKSGKPISGIKLTDGRNIAVTDSDGRYTLSGYERTNVIAAMVLTECHDDWYALTEDGGSEYNFALTPYKSDRADGSSFLHISDTEILVDNDGVGDWANFLRDTAARESVDFIIHTGDICRKAGLYQHRLDVNRDTMGVPVRYTIGNHDYVKDKYGEYTFEKYYGPVWYSFDLGGTHFVILPIKHGEVPLFYPPTDSNEWLKNDLALIPKDMPIVIFCHEIPAEMTDFTIPLENGNLDLKEYNTALLAVGHYHNNFTYYRCGIPIVSTARPDVGGIDASPSCTRLVSITDGEVTSRIIYNDLSECFEGDNPVWQTNLPSEVLYCAPLVYGGRVYVATASDDIPAAPSLFAFDQASGRIIFETPLKASVKSNITLHADKLYIQDVTSNLYVIDPTDGSILNILNPTEIRLGNALKSPVVHDGVIIGGNSIVLSAFCEKTGEKLWQNELISYNIEGKSSFVTVGDILLVGTHWRKLSAVSASTGKTVWENKDAIDSIATVGVADGFIYAPSRSGLFKLSLADGSLVASKTYEPDVGFNTVARAVVYGDEVYIATANRSVLAFSTSDLSLIREYPVSDAIVASGEYYSKELTVSSTPIVTEGELIFAAADGYVYFYQRTSGELLRTVAVGAPVLSDIVICDGILYTADLLGRVSAYKL